MEHEVWREGHYHLRRFISDSFKRFPEETDFPSFPNNAAPWIDAATVQPTIPSSQWLASKGYWSSPGGKTPWATLYSAITRELKNKGGDARFQKTDKGQFALKK